MYKTCYTLDTLNPSVTAHWQLETFISCRDWLLGDALMLCAEVAPGVP
jgi:hypothetical protein